ncbi:cell division protein FtsL [Candidatus Latescibacterota bacterium]
MRSHKAGHMNEIRKNKVKLNKLKFFIAVICIIFFLIFQVGLEMYELSLEEKVHETRNERTDMEREIKSLEMTVAALSKGSRIKKIARERLGMEMPVGAPETLF